MGLDSNQQAMAGSSAMVVSGIQEELKTSDVKLDDNALKTNFKDLEEYIQKLSDSPVIKPIKKFYGKEGQKQQKKEEETKKARAILNDKDKPKPFDWAHHRKSDSLFSIFYAWESKVLKDLLRFVLQPNIEDLIKTASDLQINLKEWKLDKININSKGEILLSGDITPEERLKILLLDECKILEVGRLLEDAISKQIIINIRLYRVKLMLKELGITDKELAEINLAARRLAFLKIVAVLKENHLKRVFSASKKEFNYYTAIISNLTYKVQNTKVDVPQEGIAWIHQRLETLSGEAARYQLELLRSLQKLGFDKEREKNIKWMEHIISGLKAYVPA